MNTIYIFLSFVDLHIYKALFLLLSGFLIRQILIYFGQYWANGYHHLVTYSLLPVIAYVVTSVISNNFALSLGMIGALSIIRFRNPVRSPLELIMFFALLTIGIAASVNILWSLFLVFFMFATLIIVHIYNKTLLNFGKSAYEITFTEGKENNLIEIISTSKIDFINSHNNLKSLNYDHISKEWSYKIVFDNKKDLHEMIKKVENIDNCSFNVDLI